MALEDTLTIAAAGMRAQGDRLRVVSENIANSDSVGKSPGAEPYRRKTIMFENVLDKETGMETVRVAKRGQDMSNFNMKYDPSHPAANEEGYVMYPNIDPLIEMMDMREARRGYEANLGVVEVSKAMLARTVELLK